MICTEFGTNVKNVRRVRNGDYSLSSVRVSGRDNMKSFALRTIRYFIIQIHLTLIALTWMYLLHWLDWTGTLCRAQPLNRWTAQLDDLWLARLARADILSEVPGLVKSKPFQCKWATVISGIWAFSERQTPKLTAQKLKPFFMHEIEKYCPTN